MVQSRWNVGRVVRLEALALRVLDVLDPKAIQRLKQFEQKGLKCRCCRYNLCLLDAFVCLQIIMNHAGAALYNVLSG